MMKVGLAVRKEGAVVGGLLEAEIQISGIGYGITEAKDGRVRGARRRRSE
jgi:hypothetical protein